MHDVTEKHFKWSKCCKLLQYLISNINYSLISTYIVGRQKHLLSRDSQCVTVFSERQGGPRLPLKNTKCSASTTTPCSEKGATKLLAVTRQISTDFQNSFTAGKRRNFPINMSIMCVLFLTTP